jgi:hypothetical protein
LTFSIRISTFSSITPALKVNPSTQPQLFGFENEKADPKGANLKSLRSFISPRKEDEHSFQY